MRLVWAWKTLWKPLLWDEASSVLMVLYQETPEGEGACEVVLWVELRTSWMPVRRISTTSPLSDVFLYLIGSVVKKKGAEKTWNWCYERLLLLSNHHGVSKKKHRARAFFFRRVCPRSGCTNKTLVSQSIGGLCCGSSRPSTMRFAQNYGN